MLEHRRFSAKCVDLKGLSAPIVDSVKMIASPMDFKQHKSASLLIVALIALVVGQTSCYNDPFDPWIGIRNPRPGALVYLSGRSDISESEKRALLDYQPCSEKTLVRLMEAPAREVRFLVAVNSSVNSGILDELSKDNDAAVRQAVASNRKTPLAALRALSEDRNENVRIHATRNSQWRP